MTVIPIFVSVVGTAPKNLKKKRPQEQEIRKRITTPLTNALLESAKILKRVLERKDVVTNTPTKN